MKCPFCGKELPHEILICPRCKAEIPTKKKEEK